MGIWQISNLQILITVLLQPWILIFTIPFIGAVISLVIRKYKQNVGNFFSILILATAVFIAGYLVIFGNREEELILFIPTVINNSSSDFFQNSIYPDPLGIFLAFIAASLGFLIALFSLDYMKDDEAQGRYYFFIQLFIGGMILLVLAGDLIILYFGWKIVGICSYFLISHWFHKPDPLGSLCAKSGVKAFLMTFIGDIALLIAIGIIWLELDTINLKVITMTFNTKISTDMQIIIAILILLAAFAKSAQFPFITWLSSPRKINIDAMQGPTTVSALIHAATMVKAGVYLISRFYGIIAPSNIDIFFLFFACIAAITAIMTALSALVSIDIKRILAYSTVSQLAYMFIGLSIGYIAYGQEQNISIEGFMGAQFHLMSHAIFKALLFLSAGAIIHSLYGERNIQNMGGLKKELPILHMTTLIGVCALAGVPFLFNGGYSKEAILGSVVKYSTSYGDLILIGWFLYVIGLITTLITAIYAFRFFFLIFYGEKPSSLKIQKPGFIMHFVTILLAILVIITGFTGPIFLNRYFEPMFKEIESFNPLEYIPNLSHNPLAFFSMLIIILIVGFGFLISYRIYYQGTRTLMPIIQRFWILNILHSIVLDGFYLDSFYTWLQELILKISWKLRKLQTGNLNYNIAEILIVSLSIIIIMMFL